MAEGFLGGSVLKNPLTSAGDIGHVGSILQSGRSTGGGNGNPLQYSCLENPMDRGAWWAIDYRGLKESDVTEQLSTLKWLKTYIHKYRATQIWSA